MLQRLLLDHFRNYDRQEIRFAPRVNCLLGQNGMGKTNVLEAIYYLSLLRSFRTNRNDNLMQFGANAFTLFGEVLDAQGATTRLGLVNSGVHDHAVSRQLQVNGTPVKRTSEFISRLLCTAFIPEDIEVIKGAPALRRRFLNIALCTTSPDYLAALQRFTSALHARNAMLKQPGKYPRATVTAYDHILVESGVTLEIHRSQCADALNRALERLSQDFFPDGRRLNVNYLSGCGFLAGPVTQEPEALRQTYRETLERNYDNDCRNGATRFGPQRSDLACLIDQRVSVHFGSEGECRAYAIALKLALLDLLRERRRGDEVTMLVDDVIGELDACRRDIFLRHLATSGQVIFAGTALPEGMPAPDKLFHVERGSVREA